MTYVRITESGRRYHAVQIMECQECLARLDDDLAIEVHEAWHALDARQPGSSQR